MTWKRVATAAVLIPLVVALTLAAPMGGVAVAVALVVLLAMFEYFALGEAIGHRAYRFWTASCAVMLVFAQFLAAMDEAHSLGNGLSLHREIGRFAVGAFTVADVLFIFLMGMAVLTLATRRPLVEALPAAGISSSALLFVALPLSYAVRVHGISLVGRYLLLFVLVITWVGDSAAYFVGRAIGKHPFAAHLSPKKTWEGAIASFLSALVVALLAKYLGKVNIETTHLIGMAAVGNVAGQMGDLLESAYKRSAGVKDSGALLPGHGGVLDRIDALILAIPVVWYYWIWIYSPRGS
ncbi:MAG TPA: phosphatidate cytidylyltransferase [Candidatus Angelobacter sp.]|jgi:phosphatidate cytidylyltransferase|nr:phosphatidate cytidylyltransferase [Candidatus Angelobacter sp.]